MISSNKNSAANFSKKVDDEILTTKKRKEDLARK